MGVQTVYSEQDIVSDLWTKKLKGRSLRDIAADYDDITYGDIARALKGIFPKSNKKRRGFGLYPKRAIVVINGRDIPEGSQVLMADVCVECGEPYISNHPRRQRCFICSPYQGKR